MKKINWKLSTRLVVFLASAVCVIGVVLATVGLFSGASMLIYADAKGLHTGNAAPEYLKRGELPGVKSLSIDVKGADIEFIQGDKLALDMCYYGSYYHPRMELVNGTLRLYDEPDETVGSRYFSIDWRVEVPDNYIKIYVPENVQFDSLNITSTSGSVSLNGFTANVMDINTCDTLFIANAVVKKGTIRNPNTWWHGKNVTMELENVTADSMMINSKMDGANLNISRSIIKNLQCSGENYYSIQTLNTKLDRSDWNVSANRVTMDGVESGGMNLKNRLEYNESCKMELNGAFRGETFVESKGNISFSTTLKADAYSWSAAVNPYRAPKEEATKPEVEEEPLGEVTTRIEQTEKFLSLNGTRQAEKVKSGAGKDTGYKLTLKSLHGDLDVNFAR